MGSPNEPPRKVDLKKWDATWERIRAKQAADKLAAEIADRQQAESDLWWGVDPIEGEED